MNDETRRELARTIESLGGLAELLRTIELRSAIERLLCPRFIIGARHARMQNECDRDRRESAPHGFFL